MRAILHGMILEDEQIQEFLKEHPRWFLVDGKIEREYSFKDFKEAMEFVNKIAEIAEEQTHHPGIEVNYNNVRLEIYSEDVAKITDRDTKFVEAVDEIKN